MVGSTGKTPRQVLTEQERELCRQGLLSDRHARRVRRAEEKDIPPHLQPKKARKKGAKRTTAVMEVAASKRGAPVTANALPVAEMAEAKETEGVEVDVSAEAKATDSLVAEESTGIPEAAGEGDPVVVAEVMKDMLAAVISNEVPTATPPAVGNSRKRRRAILQDENEDEEGETNDDVAATALPSSPPPCVIDGDANMMEAGAEQCTYLNSDEDQSAVEDREDDDSNDDWVEDWDIGELTDEDSEEEGEDLPESVCNSVAQSKKAIMTMRACGWEYGALCCL
ncbi:hypothetical protein DVH05_002801 [Phytophthora capsici]|nr:hypothetical protein DVH05_002801 [Phytophthora capsici]